MSHKAIIPYNASNSKVKDASGNIKKDTVHFVLIGQLGKYLEKTDNNSVISANITSEEILNYAFEVIYSSSALIPCRCVLVECSEDEKVQKVYRDYGFKFFQQDGKHFQYYKRL